MRIQPITIRAATEFVKQHHRHNAPPRGALWATSAWDGDRLVGVALIGRPVARMLQDGFTVEVIRCCTLDDAPKGTNSFLYGAARRQSQVMGYRKILTYTLVRESGASLRGAGWDPTVLKRRKPTGWLNRGGNRKYQDVYAEQKVRWEKKAA